MGNLLETFSLTVFDRNVRVQCRDPEIRALLAENYGQMRGNGGSADLNYVVGRQKPSSAFFIRRDRGKPLIASDDGEFLCLFERDLRIQVQKLRRDLYFIHAAALEFAGKAVMLVGTSKSGKSTTACALLHHGFRYLSDELAPVDLNTFNVFPYPRALWLRRESPGCQLPSWKIQTSWMVCVPTEALPKGFSKRPVPLGTVLFVRHTPGATRPSCWAMRPSEAAARILANAINRGAHSENGLEAAVKIAERTPSFELCTANLADTCALIRSTLLNLDLTRINR